jgi:hypothetical protein
MAAKKTAAKQPPAAKPAPKKAAAAKPKAAPAKPPAPAAKKPAPPAVVAPKKPAGNAGIAFKSAGFRLTVINELLDLGHFADGFEEAQESSEKVEDYEIDPRVQKFVDGLVLTEELLAQVVKIGPDGGDEIYAALVPVWDGEDDRFDIGTLDDVHLCSTSSPRVESRSRGPDPASALVGADIDGPLHPGIAVDIERAGVRAHRSIALVDGR